MGFIHAFNFSDPAVQALQFLDVIGMKDPSQKAQFFRVTMTQVFPFIPRVCILFLKLELQKKLSFPFLRNFGSNILGHYWNKKYEVKKF